MYVDDPVRTTVAPQLFYCAENLMAITMLCIITYRMYLYVYITQADDKQTATSRTIRHLMFSLIQLIALLIVDFISFTLINVDALTTQQKINKDKFWLDLSSLWLNMAVTLSNPAQSRAHIHPMWTCYMSSCRVMSYDNMGSSYHIISYDIRASHFIWDSTNCIVSCHLAILIY